MIFDSGGCKNSQLASSFLFLTRSWLAFWSFAVSMFLGIGAEKAKTQMDKTKSCLHLHKFT